MRIGVRCVPAPGECEVCACPRAPEEAIVLTIETARIVPTRS